jgi:hypothetical protein
MAATLPAHAELTKEELAKLAQIRVGNLISVPFRSNTNLNVGPLKGTQEILNIQPVIPVEVSPEWNIIARTIVLVIWNGSRSRRPSSICSMAKTSMDHWRIASTPAPAGRSGACASQ